MILCCRKSPSRGPLSRQRSQASTVTQSVTGHYCGGGEQSQLMLEAVAASPEGSREAPGKRTNMASLCTHHPAWPGGHAVGSAQWGREARIRSSPARCAWMAGQRASPEGVLV